MIPQALRASSLSTRIFVCAIASTLFCLSFALMGFEPLGHGALGRWYWPAFFITWSCLGFLMLALQKRAYRRTTPQNVILILAVSVICRVFVVCFTSPMLSDDIWRYIHDGRTLASGVNPYQYAPAELAVQDAITKQINHPDLVTIYQPTSQWTFAALTMISTNDRVFRLGLCVFDLAIVGLILAGLVRTGLSPWWSVLYAWHPLVLSEVAGSGHQDVIGIAMLLACLLLADKDDAKPLRWLLAGVAFAMAVAVKPIVFPLALPLAWHGRQHLRLVMAALGGAVVTGIALYLPFLLMPGGFVRLWETSQTFVENWAFNSSLHGIVWYLTGSAQLARWAAGGVLLLILGLCLWRKIGLWPTCMAYLFGSLLCSSTVYPWYLLWALALLPWCPSAGLWMFSLTVVFGYEVLGHPWVWRVPLWISIAVYVPVVVGLIFDFRPTRKFLPKF